MRLVSVLFVVTLLVTAFIAIRAQMAATYHRATAERVITDWTRFAADELARRAESQIEFYGAYPVLRMLAEGRSVPETEQEKRAFTLVNRTVQGTRGEPEETAVAVEGGRVLVTRQGVGFETTSEQLIRFAVPSALAARPLLPPSLAGGRVTNDMLFVRVSQGKPVVTTTGTFDDALGVRQTIGEGYLRGTTIEVSIAPEASRMIVFGGVPRPLRIDLVLLAIAALLTGVAVLQLARERSLMRMRTEFVASVSHELRTPLTQIRMFAETLLLDRVRSDEERRHALLVIDRESRRLGQLVDNILQFSRGERGQLGLSIAESDVARVVRETADAFAPIAASRGMRIETAIPDTLVARVDDDAIRQIVLNLLDNAGKYGPDGQTIALALEPGLRLTVEDEGPGVPPRERERIWRRYVRLDREREGAIAGAGIGLAVVRDLVRLHGGTARVEQGSRGAKFVIEVPA